MERFKSKLSVFFLIMMLAQLMQKGETKSLYPKPSGTLIVGGVEATPGEFPFIVALFRGKSHSCGGSIVNLEWVVTAAHCVQSTPSHYHIVAGDHDLTVEEGTEQVRNIDEIFIHPEYNLLTHENDIALLHLSEPLLFGNDLSVGSIEMAHHDFGDVPEGTVAGWGKTSEGGSASNVLVKAVIPFVPYPVCQEAYDGRIKEALMVCAGAPGVDSCQGDSGGPLICQEPGENGQPVLCGVVSWGRGCARPEYPGVYTRVSSYFDWVSTIVRSYEEWA